MEKILIGIVTFDKDCNVVQVHGTADVEGMRKECLKMKGLWRAQ